MKNLSKSNLNNSETVKLKKAVMIELVNIASKVNIVIFRVPFAVARLDTTPGLVCLLRWKVLSIATRHLRNL